MNQSRLTPLALCPVRKPAPAKLFGRSKTVLAVARPKGVRSEDVGGKPEASAKGQYGRASLLRGLTAEAMHLSALRA